MKRGMKKMKYKKKPVVIDAIVYTKDTVGKVLDFIEKLSGECNSKHAYICPEENELFILTLEGNHLATEGDYIIRGVKGEFYPCKPDIFEMTYEKVDE